VICINNENRMIMSCRESTSKDSRITMRNAAIRFFGTRFVQRGGGSRGGSRLSRIFVQERESGEVYIEQIFSTHTVTADNCMCAHVCSCIVNLTKSSGMVPRSLFRFHAIYCPVQRFPERHWHPVPDPGRPEAIGITAACWWVDPC